MGISEKPPSTILVGAIRLNQRDEIRLELSEFKGHNLVNLRRWFTDANGEMKPTRKGISIVVEHLPALKSLMSKALKRAKRERLLPNGGGDE